MKICGIDAATYKTGMSLFEIDADKQYELIDRSLINLQKETNKEQRIDKMILDIANQLNVWSPDMVFIEDTWDRHNIETVKMLTYIVGGVRYWCLQHEIEFHKILPSAWRKLVGLQKAKDTRQDYKTAAIQMVKQNFHLDVTDDEAESILIGMAGCLKGKK